MNKYKLEKNLKSGEELFFVSAERTSDCSWMRSPLMNKSETRRMISGLFNTSDYKKVNVQSETTLNEFVDKFDEKKGEWVKTHYTLREQQFGAIYQDDYEFFCEEFGVNLDEIQKVKSARAEYEKKVAESKVL